MKLYGKDRLKRRLDNVAAKGRLSHAIMFSGHPGSGRKTMALYTAQLLLCGNSACGECVTCRNIENKCHPDVIFVKESCGGKYTIDALKSVLKDTVILPNNGKYKVYIFEDCDTMLDKYLNALLKLIEEPSPHLKFIFICENKSVILETILSRVTEYDVPDTPVPECERCLLDMGTNPDQARELSVMFSGNIGECLDALNGGDRAKLIDIAKKAAAALGKRDAFSLCAALSEPTARPDFAQVFGYLSKILRDAMAISEGAGPESSDDGQARAIAANYTEEQIMRMLETIFEIAGNEELNLNLALSAEYFTGCIFG